jgi:DNA-binding XRE family transcriptional regulator
MKGKRVLKITINAIEREVKLVAIALSKANPNLGLATI